MADQQQPPTKMEINPAKSSEAPPATVPMQIEQPVFESLPLKDRLAQVSQFDPWKGVSPGWYVDAKDTVENWCGAIVQKVDGSEVTIAYDGWGPRYDETFRIKSFKVAPFRQHSRGYTGQLYTPVRRITYSEEGLEANYKELEEVVQSDFKILKTAHDITQYIRGKLYYYVDLLMAHNYISGKPQEEDNGDDDSEALPPPRVLDFLKLAMKAIVKWMKIFPSMITSFHEWLQHPTLQLKDRNVAFTACFYEIVDMLKSLFCQCHRTLPFYGRFDLDEEEPMGVTYTKAFSMRIHTQRDPECGAQQMYEKMAKGKDMIFGSFINMFNYFGKAEGIEAMQNMCGEGLPLEWIAFLLSSLKQIRYKAFCSKATIRTDRPIVHPDIAKSLTSKAFQCFFMRIENLSAKEIKELNKERMSEAFAQMKDFLKLDRSDTAAAQVTETHDLLLNLKFLQSEVLERKIRGLTDLKSFLQQICISCLSDKPKEKYYYSEKMLADWITKNNIADILLGPNSHAEILKRSGAVFAFLARQNMFTKAMLENIWSSHKDAHEEQAIGVYEVIKEVVPYLSDEHLDLFCEKFSSLSKSDITGQCSEKLITFIKDFTLASFAKQKSQSLNHQPSSGYQIQRPFYCFDLLWKIIEDPTIGSPLDDLAFSGIKEALADEYMENERIHYLKAALQNIKENKSVSQFASIAIYLLCVIAKMKSDPLAQKATCESLQKEYPLIELIIDSMDLYAKAVNEAIKGNLVQVKPDAIIVQKKKHCENLESRFRFLENVINAADGAIFTGKANIERLWKIYVKDSLSEYDTCFMLRYLSQEAATTGSYGVKKEAKMIFKGPEENIRLFQLLCQDKKLLLEKTGSVFLKCFFRYFEIVNLEKDLMEYKNNKMTLKVPIDKLLGIEQIWEMLETYCVFASSSGSSLETIRTEISTYIVILYRRADLQATLVEEKSKLCESFIEHGMNRIIATAALISSDDSIKENYIIEAHLKLLQLFYDAVEGKKFSNYPDRLAISLIDTIKYKISITVLPEKAKIVIDVGAHVKVGEIMKLIADTLGISFNAFILLSDTRSYDMDDEELVFNEIGWKMDMIVRKYGDTPKTMKSILLENEKYMALLFELLSKKNCHYADTVWELLMLIPCSDKIINQIKKVSEMKESVEESWINLFDYGSIHKMLYSLQGLHNIIFEKKNAEENKTTVERMAQNGGLKALYQGLLKLPLSTLEHDLSKKCFKSLMNCINMIVSLIESKYLPVSYMESIKEELCLRVAQILYAFVDLNIKQDKAAKKGEEKPAKKAAEESKIIKEGFEIIKKSSFSFNYFAELKKHAIFHDLIIISLVKVSGSVLYPHIMSKELIDIAVDYLSVEITPDHPLPYLLSLLLSNVSTILSLANYSNPFFLTISSIIEKYPREYLLKAKSLNFQSILTSISSALKESQFKPNEKQSFEFSQKGLIEVIHAILKKFPEFKKYIGQDCGLVKEILHTCLFDYPLYYQRGSMKALAVPKCKQELSRKPAFELLSCLARDTSENLVEIIEERQPKPMYEISSFLASLHTTGTWRTTEFSDWRINVLYQEKSITGYTGLQNLGTTCYMNSVLQQLYMIPSFRYDILSMKRAEEDERNSDESLLYQTQALFSYLTESMKPAVSPKMFAHTLKDWEGKPINTSIQMDADELFNMLMDRLEQSIKGKDKQNTIKAHFGGIFANQLIGKTCPHRKTREETFNTVSLQVKHKKSLIQSLETFMEGELLAAGNSYYCEQCAKKVDTLKRVCIKKLPKFLIFVLKRFEFDYDIMTKSKLNSYCEFPMEINMAPYTVKGMAMRDKNDANLMKTLEPEDYRLVGVVIHTGVAEGGHYYSLIKDREKDVETWYEFNDSNVRSFDLDKLSDEAFGGNEIGLQGIKEKHHSAYLVLYERTSPERFDPSEEGAEELAQNYIVHRPEKFTIQIEEEFHKAIIADNIKYSIVQQIFSEAYLQFVAQICNSWNSSQLIVQSGLCFNNVEFLDKKEYEKLKVKPTLKKTRTSVYNISLEQSEKQTMEGVSKDALAKLSFQVFKLAGTVFFTTLLRLAGKMTILPDFMDIAKAYINMYPEAARWVLEQFTNEKTLKEFLLTCTDPENRKLVVGLLYASMIALNKENKECYMEYLKKPDPSNTLPNFINFIISQLATVRNYTRYFDQYFLLIARIIYLGPEVRTYLLGLGFLKKLIGFYRIDPTIQWEKMEAFPHKVNEKPDIGFLLEAEDKFKSTSEERWAAKRISWMKDATPTYTFLFDSLRLLVSTMTFSLHVPPAPDSLAPASGALSEDPYLKAFFSTPANLNLLIKQATNNIGSNAVAFILSHLSFEDKQFKTIASNTIIDALNVSEWEDYKKLGFHFLQLIQVADSQQERFIDTALLDYSTMMKNNHKAFYPTFYGLENLLIYASRCKKVREYFCKPEGKSFMQWMVQWMTTNSSPMIGPHALINLNKTKERNAAEINSAGTTMSEEFQKSWMTKVLEYRGYCEDLQQPGKEFNTFSMRFDYENDFYHLAEHYRWMPGDTFDKYDGLQKAWVAYTIERVLDEELAGKAIGSEDKSATWFEIDTDSLAPSGTYVPYLQVGKDESCMMEQVEHIFDNSEGGSDGNGDTGKKKDQKMTR